MLGTVNQSPVAAISATPVSGAVPLNVAFSGSGSRDPDGTIQSYSWNFGDGGTGTGVSVSHTYGSPGNYTTVLTVKDNSGASSSTNVNISATTTSPAPNNDLVGLWDLDDGGGSIAVDSSGMGNNAAVYGGATWVTGEVGGALSLNGVDGSMMVSSVKGLASGNTPHTIAAWVNVTKLPPNRAWILLLGNEGTGAHHWLINSSGGTQLGAWGVGQATVTPVLPVGQWKHVAVTFDGTTLSGYVDGVLVGTSPATFNLQGIPLTVGHEHLWENNFNGMIDDLRIYPRALTALEVLNLRYVP